jgi:hypothetical protein
LVRIGQFARSNQIPSKDLFAPLGKTMSTKRDTKYQVGYGKPPGRTQFKKGQSGNPKGRPHGSKNATTLLKEALSEPVIITENGRRRTITKKEAIITQIVNKAASGDHRSIQLLLLSQLPLIEKSLESSESIAARAQLLPPPQSVDQKRARALEIAKILKDIGYLDQVLNAASDPEGSALEGKPDPDKK